MLSLNFWFEFKDTKGRGLLIPFMILSHNYACFYSGWHVFSLIESWGLPPIKICLSIDSFESKGSSCFQLQVYNIYPKVVLITLSNCNISSFSDFILRGSWVWMGGQSEAVLTSHFPLWPHFYTCSMITSLKMIPLVGRWQ